MANRPPTSVLGQTEKGPRIKSPNQTKQQSKAKKFFQQASKPPTTISHLPTTAPGTRVGKPLVQDVSFNPDDPMYKIEESANKIGKIVKTYENEKEEERQKMLLEMDSNYMLNSYEPGQILEESRKVVDNLISKNAELKDTQSDMLSSLYSWLHREEKILSSQTDGGDKPDLSTAAAMTTTSEDILGVLNSSEGSNQQRISKAMCLHSDMMSKALLALNHLETQNSIQAKLINDLQTQIKGQNQKKQKTRVSKPLPQNAELQKMLEQSQSRVSAQEDTIKRLNSRIEQLIAQSINESSARSKGSVTDDEYLSLQHENLSNKVRIQKLESDNQNLKDEIFKRKYRQMTLEAEKDFLETQNTSLQELLEVERAKLDSATRDFLNKLNGQSADDTATQKINELRQEINKLKAEKEIQKKQMHDEMISKLNMTRKEFEIRELELKKRSIGQAVGSSHQMVLEALQHQHDEEMEHVKNDYEDQISAIRRSNAEQLKQIEITNQQKMKEIHDQMNMMVASAGGKNAEDLLSKLQKQFDDRELERKTHYAAKIEMIRTEFMRKQKKLEDELMKREIEIDKMVKLVANADVIDSREVSRPISPRLENGENEENNENNENNVNDKNGDDENVDEYIHDVSKQTKQQIDNAVGQYAKKIEIKYHRKLREQKELLDEEWKTKIDEVSQKFEQANVGFSETIERLNEQIAQLQSENQEISANAENDKFEDFRSQIVELQSKIDELEGYNKKLEDENESLQKTVDQGNTDRSYADLSKTFAEQTEELMLLKFKLEEMEKKNNDLSELKKIELPILSSRKSILMISDSFIITKFISQQLLSRSTPSSLLIQPSLVQNNSNNKGYASKIVSNSIETKKSLFISLSTKNFDVSVQAELSNLPQISHSSLASQPPIEIFAVRGIELRPEFPVVLTPSENNQKVRMFSDQNKDISDSHQTQLLTKKGELIDIPHIGAVTAETHPAASSAAAQFAIGDAKELSRQLQFVVNEMQTIENEPDESKKNMLKETKGVALEIQKDNVVSQMRERITELEQMVQRLNQTTDFIPPPYSTRSINTLVDSEAWQIATQTDESIIKAVEDGIIPLKMQQFSSETQITSDNSDPNSLRQNSTLSSQSRKRVSFEIPSEQNGTSISSTKAKNYQNTSNNKLSSNKEKYAAPPNSPNLVSSAERHAQIREELENRIISASSNTSSISQKKYDDDDDDVKNIQNNNSSFSSSLKTLANTNNSNDGTSSFVIASETPFQDNQNWGSQTNSLEIQQTETGFISRQQTPISIMRREGNLPNLGVFKVESTELFGSVKSPHKIQKMTKGIVEYTQTATSATNSRPSTAQAYLDEHQNNVKNQKLTLETGNLEEISIKSSSMKNNEKTGNSEGNRNTSLLSTDKSVQKPALRIQMTSGTNSIASLSENNAYSKASSNTSTIIFNANDSNGKKDNQNNKQYVTSSVSTENDTISMFSSVNDSNNANDTNNSKKLSTTSVSSVSVVASKLLKPLKMSEESTFEIKLPTRQRIDISNTPKAVVVRHQAPLPSLQAKQQEIELLKSSLLNIQNSSPEESAKVVHQVQAALDSFSQNLQNSTEPVVLLDSINKSQQISQMSQQQREQKQLLDSETQIQNLKEAIETTNDITQKIVDKASLAVQTQTSIVNNMNRAAVDFLKEMDKGSTSSEEQSHFLRNVNTCALQIGSSVADLKAEVLNPEKLIEAFKTAQEELKKHEELIKALRDENFNLKVKNDAPRITTQMKMVKNELSNLINQKQNHSTMNNDSNNNKESSISNSNNENKNIDGNENQLFNNFDDASRVISSLMSRAYHDNTVSAAKAVPLVEKLTKAVNKTRPDWKEVTSLVDQLESSLDNENTWRRSEALVRDVYEHNDQLFTEIQKLRTEKAISDRDLIVAKAKNENEIEHIKKSLELANQQNEVLEKQLKNIEILNKSQSQIDRKDFDILKKELTESQEVERQRVAEIGQLSSEKSQLEKEHAELQQKLQDLQQKYESLFNQATDTQTEKQILESRTSEILRRAEVDSAKARALEHMNSEAHQSLDQLTDQLVNSVSENEQLSKKLIEAEDKISLLENQLLHKETEERLHFSNTNSTNNIASSTSSNSNINSNNNSNINNSNSNSNEADVVPRMVRMYQQKADLYQMQLQQRGSELISMKSRRAEDAKSLIMLRREIQRGKSDTRLQQLRFDSAKAELELTNKMLADRDESIRQLKREIQRLRSMLAFQQPTKQQVRQIQRERNENAFRIDDAKKSVLRYQKQAAQFSSNATMTKYLGGLMARQNEAIVRLERKRREISAIEENSRILALQAMAHVVRKEELEIPEDIIMKIMPKPAPVQKLKFRQQQQNRSKSQQQQQQQVQTKSARSIDLVFNEDNNDEFENGNDRTMRNAAPHYKQFSYADTLQQIGQLAGKVPPQVLHEMLRNASRNNRGPPMQQQQMHQEANQQKTKKQKKGANSPIMGMSITPISKPK